MNIQDIEVLDRRGTRSTKWDGLMQFFGSDDLLPMWVADMDFRCPTSVGEALHQTARHNLYGYYLPSDGYYDAFIDWEKRHHGYQIDRSWIRYSTGTVSGIFWILNFMTRPGDACIILSPCYYPFMDAILQNGRKLICSFLKQERGVYSIDMADFEEKIVAHDVKLFILCSPHNPVGRVWRTEELKALLDICRRHHVFVISDEIHQDIIIGSRQHTPTAAVGDYNDMLITITGGSKTFNLAGSQNSYVIIPDKGIRDRFDDYTKQIRVTRGSMFGYIAMEAAYRGGEEWLKTILEEIRGNYHYCRDFLAKRVPEVVVSPLEATYLMWVDLGTYLPPEDIEPFMLSEPRIAVDYGTQFMPPECLDTHVRFNLATPRANVVRAMDQLSTALERRLSR